MSNRNEFPRAAVIAFVLAALPLHVSADPPDFVCPPGLDPVGSPVGNVITVDGETGNLQFSSQGGCALPGQGIPTEDVLVVSELTAIQVAGVSSVQISAPQIEQIILSDPGNLQLRYELRQAGQPVYQRPGWTPFTYPFSGQIISNVLPGIYQVHMVPNLGTVAVEQPIVQVQVAEGSPPADHPTNWNPVDSTKNYVQKFGVTFANGSNGIQTLPISARFSGESPSDTTNTVFSYSFTVGAAGEPKYGHFGGATGSTGGTPWFFISEIAPADIGLIGGVTGVFSSKCAAAGASTFSWMVQGTSLPPDSNPSAASRCQLVAGRTYYLNVLFYHLKKLIEDDEHLNSCIRPPTNPTQWSCSAKLRGDVLQAEPGVPEDS